jgi:hypothetical protein
MITTILFGTFMKPV